MQTITLYCCIDIYSCTNNNLLKIKDYIYEYLTLNKHDVNIKLIEVKLPPRIIFDCIHDGLMNFCELYKHTKLLYKSQFTNIWYMYISNGCIRNIYKNVNVILLNQNPSYNRAKYVINKHILPITYDMSDAQMEETYNIFMFSLEHLFNSNKFIVYDNLDYNYFQQLV